MRDGVSNDHDLYLCRVTSLKKKGGGHQEGKAGGQEAARPPCNSSQAHSRDTRKLIESGLEETFGVIWRPVIYSRVGSKREVGRQPFELRPAQSLISYTFLIRTLDFLPNLGPLSRPAVDKDKLQHGFDSSYLGNV